MGTGIRGGLGSKSGGEGRRQVPNMYIYIPTTPL